MQIIVVGAGVTGIACAHSLLKRGHKVTLIESASSPNQGCSFGMAGFMGALSIAMLCSPFKGKAGLASVFAKTRRLGWDMSLSHMKFLRSLANSRSADKWKKDSQSLIELARYSVGLTEFEARLQDISFEQTYGLLRLYTNETVWEEAHKEEEARKGGEWLDAEETRRLENSIEVPDLLGSFYMPQELSGNGSYYSKQIQMLNIADPDLTMMYHTTVTKLIKGEDGKITGVETDKGEISADAGLIGQRDFGGTKKWRTCFVSDGTGHAMLNSAAERAIAHGIPVHERVEAIALIHDGQRCYGAVVRDLITGELIGYVARATAIATGGAGKLFRVSTNAQICEGTGHAIALETGVAKLGNMEAVQFHPTGIFPAGILVTEGCRGDGGLLRDVDGHRFMPDVEPEKKELASRDVVSRRMEERIAQGKGVKSRFGEHLWLDITLLGENHIKHNLREVYEICHYFLGVDPTKDWIPVRPAQHYTMGGVRTNPSGESQTLKGLFSAGEAACWDMHGFNRLGGNSVAETVVAGMIVGEKIADFCDKPENAIDIPTKVVYDFIRREQSKLDAFAKNSGTENMAEIRTRMQEIMTTKVGIFRNGDTLEQAVTELEELYKKSFNVAVKNQPGANPELVYAYRTQKMLRVALTIALGAYKRTESRGAHFRIDYPVRNDAEWCCRTLASWKNENDTMPTLEYQKLDISKMELPPGWRGYGAKNYIDNPETPIRQKEVDEIRAKMEAEGKDRFAIQNALMPYLQLLPENLRGRNERIDEPLS